MELWVPPATKTGITSTESGFLDALYYYQAQIDMIEDADEKQLLYFAAANSLNSAIPRGAAIDAQANRAAIDLPNREDTYVNVIDVGIAGTLEDVIMTLPSGRHEEYSDTEQNMHYQLMLSVQVEEIYSLVEDERDTRKTKGRIPIAAAKVIMLSMAD